VVRRIFRTVADGHSLYSAKRSLELDGIAPPGNGATARGQYWGVPFLRKLIEDDVYRPHTREDIAGLVAEGLLLPEVAASLDKSAIYGVSWFNRTRTTRKRISKAGSTDKEYRWQKTVRQNPREQWIAIPVPDAGIPLEVVKTARKEDGAVQRAVGEDEPTVLGDTWGRGSLCRLRHTNAQVLQHG
jgi:hypothetical protein